MNRILRRPMFRMGGTPNEGIMTGLKEPRVGYSTGSTPPGTILTTGGGTMAPSGSSPIGTSTRFFPPTVTQPAGVPATLAPTPEKIDFMRRAGQLTGQALRSPFAAGIGTLLRGGTLPAVLSGPAIIAALNKPETLEELQVMKEQGALDETMSEEDLADFEKRREEARQDGTPIGAFDTSIFSSEKKIEDAIEKFREKNEPKVPPPGEKKDDGLGELGTSDFEKSLNEYLPAIESALKVDDEATKRNLFLQLAKFGAGLASQPGGSLSAAIGRAAQEPLRGVEKVLTDKQAAKRQAKLIAVQAAIKDLGPSNYGKTVRDIQKTFDVDKKEAGKIYNKILANDSTALSKDQTSLKDAAREDLRLKGGAVDAYVSNVRLMREEYPELIGKFNKVAQKEDKLTDKEYYVTPEGAFVRYDKETDSFLLPGDPGFAGSSKKTK